MSDTEGLVIKNTGSWYTVLTDGGSTVDCKIKGNFRLKGIRSTNPVAVGDRVEIIRNQEGTAFITSICDLRAAVTAAAALLLSRQTLSGMCSPRFRTGSPSCRDTSLRLP